MLDLHMHTRYSDGSDEVSMVLEKAEKLKLKCIAITDHNTCLEYNELKDEKIYCKNILMRHIWAMKKDVN